MKWLLDFLKGTWLAHPLHPILVHVPMAMWPGALVLLLISNIATSGISVLAGGQAEIAWSAVTEIASGGGRRGPWQQNESKYDYVDDPTVALDAEGAAALAWVDQRQKGLLFQIYDRNGKPRLSEPVNVSRSSTVFSWLPRVVLSPTHLNEVFILWQEIVFSGGSHGGEIFFARSRDGGASFNAPINLSNSINDSWHNGSLDLVICPDGTLCAAWTEYNGPLWFSSSSDRGESFSKPIRIAGGGEAKPARGPALAAGSENILYLGWTVGDEDSADIRVAKSTDNGRTFGEPAIVAQTKGYSDAPKLAVDRKGTVHVAYGESSGESFDPYHVSYARSQDRARTFEPGREISQPHPPSIEGGGFSGAGLGRAG